MREFLNKEHILLEAVAVLVVGLVIFGAFVFQDKISAQTQQVGQDVSGEGNNGESCVEWLVRTVQATSNVQTRIDQGGGNYLDGKCVYKGQQGGMDAWYGYDNNSKIAAAKPVAQAGTRTVGIGGNSKTQIVKTAVVSPAPSDWQNVSGEGNNGESCLAWLTRAGQNGSARRAVRADGSLMGENSCLYNDARRLPTQWVVLPENFASGIYYPGAGPADGSAFTQVLKAASPPSPQPPPVTASLTVSCGASPGVIDYSSKAKFTATASGGVAPYTYKWSDPCDGKTASFCVTLPLISDTTVTVDVNDSSGRKGSASCSVEVNPPNYILFVSKSGDGSGVVTSNPIGIDCGNACSAGFGLNSSVILTATPDSNSTFIGWTGGDCSGASSCSVTMDGFKSIGATFAVKPGPTVSRTLTFTCDDARCLTSDTIKISNTGDAGSALNWFINQNNTSPWLYYEPYMPSGSIPAGSSFSFTPFVPDTASYISSLKASNKTKDQGNIRICNSDNIRECEDIIVKVTTSFAVVVPLTVSARAISPTEIEVTWTNPQDYSKEWIGRSNPVSVGQNPSTDKGKDYDYYPVSSEKTKQGTWKEIIPAEPNKTYGVFMRALP